MLKSLSVRNYALIQNLSISFPEGFSVMTGETGAGKSIILGALNMILGQRADLAAIIEKDEKCVIEAQFALQGTGLEPFFIANDLDFDALTIIRREITPSGKSRAFINDTPVTLDILKELTGELIDIHSQHENLLLNNSNFQLQIVDGLANNSDLLYKYTTSFLKWSQLKKELEHIRNEADKAATEKDYLEFQFNQLESAALSDPDEQRVIEEELGTLSHAEEIKLTLSHLSEAIDGDEASAIHAIREAILSARKTSAYMPFSQELEQRLESVLIELKDISGEAWAKANDIEHSPEKIELLTERLNLLNELQHKHRVSSLEELMALRDEMGEKLGTILGFDNAIIQKEKAVNVAFETMSALAGNLSNSRQGVFEKLGSDASALLNELGMPHGILAIQHSHSEQYSLTGVDRITFLFSSNKHTPQPLAKIASGGEKSRLMLALKSLHSTGKSLPTIIFDEIDTGISGLIASKMGKILQRMGHTMQVIAITHLPQIAASGKHHFKVYKTNEDKPATNIVQLKPDERIYEIATLLSSENVTETSLNNARELMGN